MTIVNGTAWEGEEAITNYLAVQIIFYIVYGIIFTLGLSGNILVCYVVYSNKAMQTVTNLFITNLALSDILLCSLCVPFTPLYTFIRRWVFGKIVCHLVPYAQAASVYVSTLTLTAIAIDRFFVILYPLKQRMKLSTCLFILCGIWSFSMLVTLPYGICMEMKKHNDIEVCEEAWPPDFDVAFGVSTLILQFIAPFCIITYCYVRISRRLNERAKSKPGTKSARREEAEREKKKRTNRMLIAMVSIVGICWLPLNLINVINDFYNLVGHLGIYFHLIFFLTHSLAVSSTCYNPFLYAWLNENFRKEFQQTLPFINRQRRNRLSCLGNEHTLDTLLLSTSIGTPSKQLLPREPVAEKFCSPQEFNL